MSQRPKIQRMLFGQISLALVLLFILLGPAVYFALKRTFGQADDLYLQFQLWNSAQEMALDLAPLLQSPRDQWAIENRVYQVSRMNPLLDFYLLSDRGEIIKSFSRIPYSPKRKQITLKPLGDFFEKEVSRKQPTYGDDPEDPEGQALFSAAPLFIDGKKHFLYATFRGTQQRHAYQVYAENSLWPYAGMTTMVCLLIVLCSGLLLFFVLSRRVGRTVAVMRAFRDGDQQSRIRSRAKDELGELADTFDEMADRIVDSVSQLERRDALRRELIASVSHDLRGPLANIAAHVENLAYEAEQKSSPLTPTGTPSAQNTEAIDTIGRNAHQLGELLSQLFELSKLEAREIIPQQEDYLIESLFEDLTVSYRPKAKELGLRIEYEPLEPALSIYADLTMIARVLGNLIENAFRFTKTGGLVTLSAKREGAQVRLAVRDSGSGIPEGELGKIFEKFYQTAEGKVNAGSSTGLGLAIVRRLVELHGSQIQVKSVEGNGAEFYFFLPILSSSPTIREHSSDNPSSRP